jgi:hypothetical protein
MKYKVLCGAFVEYLRFRQIIVSANSQEEAEEKARDKFEKIFKNSANVGTVSIDSCEQLEGK